MITRLCSARTMERNELLTTTVMVLLCLRLVELSVGQAMPGGLQPANVDNEKLEQIAKIGINFLNKKLEDNQLLKLLRVEDVQTQMAQGRVYHLKLNVTSTNCTKDMEQGEQNNCEETEESSRKLCLVKVWEWRGKVKATKGSCENIIATQQLTEANSALVLTLQANTTEEIPSEDVKMSTHSSVV